MTAAMLASPAFAASDKDSQAKAAHAAGDEKKCIEITSKALQDLQNSEKGGQ